MTNGRTDRPSSGARGNGSSAGRIVQGKPVARRGRKARDLRKEDRPVADDRRNRQAQKESTVKGNLVRLTWALTLLASMALTIGAGLRWN
jgi:Na+/glutamate symporter